MNNLLTKRLVRKAAIVAGRLLRNAQQHLDSDEASEKDLRWIVEAQMIKTLKPQAEIRQNGSLGPKGMSDEWEFILNAVDDHLEFKSQRSQYVCSITLMHHDEVVMAALMSPEQNELFFASKDQNKAYRNNEQISVSSEEELANCSIVVHLSSGYDNSVDFNFSMFQELFQMCGRVLTKGSYLFACTQVASGKMSGLIAIDVNYQEISGGLLLIQSAGGKVTDENGQPFSPDSRVCIATNGQIHDHFIEVFKKKWA